MFPVVFFRVVCWGLFFWPEPVAFRRIYGLEAYSRTSRESNHHRQSVSAVKNNALPTEPRGHLWCAGVCVLRPVICLNLLLWCLCGVAGSCWPLVVVVVSSSVALLVSAFGVWGCFGLARALALFPPVLPATSVCPLVPSGPVSFLLVPSSGYLVVFATARLSCLWHGVL